jgi:tRNA A37 threonylcarbamoyladenosine modification protein TsaB
MDKISIGIAAGYLYTSVFLSKNGLILNYFFFKNSEFSKLIAESIDTLCKNNNINNIDYITIFTGPTPLTTCRSICAWVKGWSLAKNITVINVFGEEFYLNNQNDKIIMSLFSGKYLLINSNLDKKIIEAKDINKINAKDFQIVTNNISKNLLENNFNSINILTNIEKISKEAFLIFSKKNRNDYKKDIFPYSIL